MKRGFAILMSITMLFVILGSAMAESATTDNAASSTSVPSSSDRPMMGTITEIGDGSITISVNANQPPQDGNAPQGGSAPQGGNAPQGGAQPDAGNQPSGDKPSGNPPENGNGQPGNQQSGGTDTAKSVIIAVTSSTTITLRDSQTAVALTDLTVGMMVSVTVTGDETSGYTATSIEAGDAQPEAPAATVSAS